MGVAEQRGLDAAVVRGLVADAVRAPSSHNTQPWLFSRDGGAIELLADRLRALPVNDPHDRELTVSCGAALLNLRVAVARSGRTASVDPLPAGTDGDLLARLTVGSGDPDPALAALHPGVAARRTCRGPFTEQPLDPALVEQLGRAAALEGAVLVPVTAPDRRQTVHRLVEEGDRAQFDDAHWRRELAAWLHPRRRGDGLPVPALAVPAVRFAVATLDMGERTAAHDLQRARDAPLLAVLTTAGDEPADWLAAGQALERLLLVAAVAGVQASYLNQPCQVAALRPRLRAALPGDGFPQLVLRLGHPAEPPPAAPRRPVDDVLVGLAGALR